MLTPIYTKQFERDTRRMNKRGKNLEKLKIIIRSIARRFYQKVQALNNRILLKKLLRSAAQSKDIASFKKVLQEIHSEQPEE